MYFNPANRKVAHRQRLEISIVLSLIDELLSQGFAISVDDGGDEAHAMTEDRAAIIENIMETDDDTLYAYRGAFWGCVRLIYGNDGWDVVSDYTVNMEPHIASTLRFAESLEE